MPESVTDRPTKAHEYVFLAASSERYFYDAEAVLEPLSPTTHASGNGFDRPARISHGQGSPRAWFPPGAHGTRGPDGQGMRMPEKWSNPAGRNLRSVWTIAAQLTSEAHFATFPDELARRCIAAGTSERGCCPRCGAPWRRVLERQRLLDGHQPVKGTFARPDEPFRIPANGVGHWRYSSEVRTLGWRSGCRCEVAEPVPCLVLDPFAGSGTTLAVARRMGRRAEGVELQAAYLPLAQRRAAGAALPLLEAVEAT